MEHGERSFDTRRTDSDSKGHPIMRMLVATAQTQGARINDYNFCVEGELVWIAPACTSGGANADSGCGCGRGFGGLNSHRATTTAMVVERPGLGRADYLEAIRSSLTQQGWPGSLAEEIADSQLALAGRWPPGTVIERRLDEFRPRAMITRRP
jgi:hypothetical protein